MKATLMGTGPPIWRRLRVSRDVTLSELATIVNRALGWKGTHIHEFFIGKEVLGRPLPVDDDLGLETKDDRTTTLGRVAPRQRSALKYQYDGGNCWMHRMVVEEVLAPAPDQRYPVCLDGSRACPPEDCGGIPGFHGLLAALADPKNPDHTSLTAWVGGGLDPEAFDLEQANRALRSLR